MSDNDGVVTSFFRAWFRGVFEVSTTFGLTIPSSPLQPYFVNFRNDYSSSIIFTSYAKSGEASDVVMLNEAFPVNLGDQTWAWDNTDSYQVLPITFSFRNATYTGISAKNTTSILSGLSAQQALNRIVSQLSGAAGVSLKERR